MEATACPPTTSFCPPYSRPHGIRPCPTIPEAGDRAFRRFRATGDADDFARFFEHTSGILRRMAKRMVADPDTVDELVQSTFVAAIEHSASFDGSRSVLPWLRGILQNRARHLLRTGARAPDPTRIPTPPEPRDPAGVAEARDLAAAVRAAIAYLPRTYQAVLSLHFGKGLTPAEISSSLNQKRSTVRTQLVRGLHRLRCRLRETGLIAECDTVLITRSAAR